MTARLRPDGHSYQFRRDTAEQSHSQPQHRPTSAHPVEVRRSAAAYRFAELHTSIDRHTGEILDRQVHTHISLPNPGGARIELPESIYPCDPGASEVDTLRTFLEAKSPLDEHLAVHRDSGVDRLLEEFQRGEVNPTDIAKLFASLRDAPDLVAELAAQSPAVIVAEAVELQKRRRGLARLQAAIETPSSTEHEIHRELKEQTWIFGGHYTGEVFRRMLTIRDVLDIPLVRGDGSLHIVEIKRANVASVVQQHRSHWIVGSEVHKAVVQAANYLRTCDEKRDGILADYSIDVRRASATVVIGHRIFVRPEVDAEALTEAVRTYNSHLSRIQVLTYDELIESAHRFISLAESPQGALDDSA